MTAHQRTICHSAYIFFFVVLSAYILQDSPLGMTASERRTDIHVSNDKQSQLGQEETLGLMKFSELYAQSIELWPIEILISDANQLSDKGSQYFPTLVEISLGIEDQIDYAQEHWKSLGHWALFGAFQEEAKRVYCVGGATINTRSVSLERINDLVLVNLRSEGWENELAIYKPYPA